MTAHSSASDTTELSENPMLDFSGLPRFADFRIEQIDPALDKLLEAARQALVQATDAQSAPSWETVVQPLELATEQLGRAWGIVGHLSSVDDSAELREAHNRNLPRVTQFWTELGQSTDLFERYKALRASDAYGQLSATRKRIVDNAIRDFKLGGADLQSPARERYAEIQERSAALGQKFSENVLDATNAFECILTDEADLAGLPQDAIDAAAADAERNGQQGYRFTLQFPSYFPVMQYSENRALRERLYTAYCTRASEQALAPQDENKRNALDNTPVIDEILQLRAEESQLLGYDNFAQVSLVPKMAETPDEVIKFLRDLAARARPFAEKDLQEVREFAKAELGMAELEAWDITYASEKLRQKRYAFSDQEVKPYFQLPRVLSGLFAQVEKLFNVRIKHDESSAWHETVEFFRIERDGVLLGQFYLDLFARETKRPGAWMNGARSRAKRPASTQSPIAYLVCNFQPPVGEQPALLTHNELTTLFHEFGHGLHHMLTQVDELSVSGISGVEWDAVELPSQFMENFCWEWPIIESMTQHVKTGLALPRELFDKMIAARNFQAGMQTLRQIEFALFDMQLHSKPTHDPASMSVQQVLDTVREEVSVVTPPAFNRFQNGFSHIFAGGYSAGYYSYKWAEVLSADAYSAFEEAAAEPAADQAISETGRKFLDEILAVGGSRPAIASFRAFRGRDPQIDALLRHNGMNEESLSE
ncbi:MAG: M3 family metallopeptidase [Burkholderiaceae bacterium]